MNLASLVTNSASSQSTNSLQQMGSPVVELGNVSHIHPGGVVAVDHVTLCVPSRTIVGLLGPNGAGKSTLINIICGLTLPSSGNVRVAGEDPHLNTKLIRYKVGAQLQGIPFPQHMRVYELLRLFSKFYTSPLDVTQLLRFVGLEGRRSSFCTDLSGGEKQRLSIARALIGDPELLILDEPTTGLDVAMRNELLSCVEGLRAKGRTIIMSTHDVEEAERLCDLIIVMKEGRLVTMDSPAGLVNRFGRGESLWVRFTCEVNVDELRDIAGARTACRDSDSSSYRLFGENAEMMLQKVVMELSASGTRLGEARVIRSGLEEAYLNLLEGRE